MKIIKALIKNIFESVARQSDNESRGGLSATAMQDLRTWIATFDNKTDKARKLNMRPAMSIAWIVTNGHPVITHAYLTSDREDFATYFPQKCDNGNPIDLENATRMLRSLKPKSSGYVVVRGTQDEPSNREILAYEQIRHEIETTHGLH